MRKYYVNLEEFKHPTLPETAYILGLMWADGHLSKTGNTISTTCIKSDLQNVEKAFDKLGTWGKYYRIPNSNDGIQRQEQMSIVVSDKRLHEFLQEKDYQSKSWASADKILNLIPTHLHSYWWRGFSDGDGCFYSKQNFQFFFTGPLNQNWQFVEELFENLNLKFKTVIKQSAHGCYSRRLLTRKADIIRFGNYIYSRFDKDHLGFTRKWLRFESFVKNKPKQAKGLGVTFHTPTRTWCARITHNKKKIYLGYYHNKEEAISIVRKTRESLGYRC